MHRNSERTQWTAFLNKYTSKRADPIKKEQLKESKEQRHVSTLQIHGNNKSPYDSPVHFYDDHRILVSLNYNFFFPQYVSQDPAAEKNT